MKRHLKSLREYIDALKEIDELQEINQEVDWNLEIGAICRRCYETGAPGPDEKMSMHTAKVIYNCLSPNEWRDELPKRTSFAGTYPLELQQKVLQKWQTYGFR